MTALSMLERAGYDAYLVGGCVRDFLMEKIPDDYDITTPSTPDETKKVFEGFPVFLQGEKHGTVGVVIGTEKIEITTHRRDGQYSDFRRPEKVDFSRTVDDDLSRRDFTVNAMAYSLRFGTVDLFGGIDDVKKRIIRCVGNPDRRFSEDALRILRALRFSSTLGFTIEKNTEDAIFDCKDLLKFVSTERIREELLKLIDGQNVCAVLKSYREIFEMLLGKIDIDGFSNLCTGLTNNEKRVLFFALTDGVCIDKLKFSASEGKFLKNARELYLSFFPKTQYDIKKAVSVFGAETLSTVFAIKGDKSSADLVGRIVSEKMCVQKKDMLINGDDLISMGFKQGSEIGRVLETLFNKVLRGDLPNSHNELIQYAKRIKDDSISDFDVCVSRHFKKSEKI